MAEKEGKQLQQEGQPQVPDTPPTPSAATQERLPAAQPSSQQTEQPASIEEIQQRAAQMRQDKAAASAKGGLVEGVREEVMLIKWPAPLKAVLNTFLVIGIVAGTSAVLLGINSVLTEISNAIY
ncbi:hypothetical protein D9Q98_006550 [Chlorella vulgaris]|uniref:Preprotein translocase subunit SecE n=1 Tax=Chlorella vulgaris TaxID=3077 RepID=A0A9D4TKF0_CHLVU|nr:hypothetical protein D9Q98_006550 [Chlorella vulgaris]